MAQTMFEEINSNYESILVFINELSHIRTQIADKQQIETNERFSSLINNILLISLLLSLGPSHAIFTTMHYPACTKT